MFPYHDENETQRTPIVTMALIGLNVLAWIGIQGAGAEQTVAASVCNFGLVPAELTASLPPGVEVPMGNGLVCVTDPGREPFHLFTSMFLHGGWMHLLGNMWFLWLFGNNIEDSTTRPRFVIFYLLCGIAAALAQVLANPQSRCADGRRIGRHQRCHGRVPGSLSASACVHVHPARVSTPRLWHFPRGRCSSTGRSLQVAGGISSTFREEGGGVAFWAHLGGLVAGVVLIKLFERRDKCGRAHVAPLAAPARRLELTRVHHSRLGDLGGKEG